MEIITGEKIQMLCDHYIASPDKFTSNPYFKNSQEKFLNLWAQNSLIDNKQNIFCYGDLLPYLGNRLLLFKNPFILVIGNSDENFDQKYIYLLDIPKLIKIITQNKNVIHDRVIPLPIGLANSMWQHGRPDLLKLAMGQEKTKSVYFYFSIHTNQTKRQDCFDKLTKKRLQFGTSMDYGDYVTELGKHQFAICPDGNGLDTHRLWECIYLKVVPICSKSILTIHFSKLFPIVILDDWDDYTLPNQKFSWENRQELYMDFYSDLLNK